MMVFALLFPLSGTVAFPAFFTPAPKISVTFHVEIEYEEE
jgi:hypothetical protein